MSKIWVAVAAAAAGLASLASSASAQAACKPYTVVENVDYCELIADKNHITLAQLLQFNPGLVCDELQGGQRLCVTAGVMPPPATPGPRPDGSCAFRDADTGSSCESLAANCGIDLAAFTFLNPIDCQDIQPNQRFCCSRGVKPTRAPKQLPNGGCFPYTVRDQDSCESLAASHDLTVAQIEQWNAGTFHWQGCGNLWTDTAMCLSPGTPPKPAIDPQAECGPTSVGDKHCPLSLCCGPAGYCGSTPEFCAPATGFPCIYDCGMATIPTTDGSAFQRRVGYYTSWAASRAIKPVRPEDLALAGYTHVNYAFAVITNGNLAFDSEEDAAVAQRLLARKKEFPSLKILISVGGWSFSEDDATKMIFSQVFSSPGSRAQFINSVNSFLGTWGFDGLDIDFEYPAAMERNGPIEDVKNLAAFWREARAGMRGNYLLTAALPADAWFLKGYDIPSLRDNTDFLNLMSYDYHGPWDATSAGAWDPTAYMKANPQTSQLSIEASTLLYRKAGIPLEKVNLGIAFYGRNYKLSDPSCGHYGCGMTGAGAAGPASGEEGYVAYFEVVDILAANNIVPNFDDASKTKYFTYKGDLYTYDDKQTWDTKISYAKIAGFGGYMVWAMDLNLDGDSNTIGSLPTTDPASDLDDDEWLSFLPQEAWLDPNYGNLNDAQLEGYEPATAAMYAPFNVANAYPGSDVFDDSQYPPSAKGPEDYPNALETYTTAAALQSILMGTSPLAGVQCIASAIQTGWDTVRGKLQNAMNNDPFSERVRGYLFGEAEYNLRLWLYKNHGKYFTCADMGTATTVSPSRPVPGEHCFKIENSYTQYYFKAFGTSTWSFRPGMEDQFYADVEKAIGYGRNEIMIGNYDRLIYRSILDNSNLAILGDNTHIDNPYADALRKSGLNHEVSQFNMPMINHANYPIRFAAAIAPLIESKPDFSELARLTAIPQLEQASPDADRLRAILGPIAMNFAAMAEMYNSVQWARHVDGEIEKVITQISEAWREAAGVSTRDLVLALVFMVGGELIAPIIAGARLAVAALRASTSTIRASEEVSILAREIEAGAAGDATAASQVTKSSAWKDSAVGRAITKVKDTLDKSINKVSICAWGSAAWQAGDLVSGQVLTRRDVGKSLYRPVLLPPSFNLSISKWLDDIHDDEHFLDLEERDLGGRVANSWSIVGKSDVPVKQQKKSFYKSGRNRNGFTYMQEGWFQGSRPGATVSFPSPTGVVDEPVADVVKRITGMDVEHALEKAPYFDNTITPISEAYKGANPAVKKEIEAALSGEHEMLVGKENVKISINDHFVDLIHGPGNVYICEHGTNMAKTAFYQLKGLSDRYRHFATLFALLETWTGKRINARDMAIAGLDRRQQLTEELIKRLRSRKTIPTQLIDDLEKRLDAGQVLLKSQVTSLESKIKDAITTALHVPTAETLRDWANGPRGNYKSKRNFDEMMKHC